MGNKVEWDLENNVEHMWEQMKWSMVESARVVCGSVVVEGENPKSVWWNDLVKAAVKRKEVLGASYEEKGVWKSTKKKRGRLKGVDI